MKPGDHPDFFKLPPPPGRSRESRIVLDRAGRFWNAGVRVDHAGMASAFASWIRLHPDDGRFILANGYDWTYFAVEDVPFFVRHVSPCDGGAGLLLLLSDGTEEPLDPARVEVSAEGVLYARVKGGQFDARFSPSAQSAMADFLVEGPSSGSGGAAPSVEVASGLFPIRSRRVPEAAR